MAISTPTWYSPPSPPSLTSDQDAPYDLNTEAFGSAFPYTTCTIPQMESIYTIPPYPSPYLDTIDVSMVPELEQSISTDSRNYGSERNDMINELSSELKRGQNRASRERKPKSQGSRTRETSHDSTDSVTEKTPAQKMRRLVQNRVSQRNFRKRQANERQRLEDQVKMLSTELHNLGDMYQDLLSRYEQAQSEKLSSSELVGGWVGGAGTLNQFNLAGLE
ncbi:putative transcription factor bzip protein [Botrytis fragariae]|uniref:Putative transcription factor bzip protein n=1 Tax=Botrytis fragariae TaxID=1964551 RepID=A0A8H6EMC9_9HELO|nr:putative transcription factor bzip protein [Botrytis fragariae]KAF5877548.1 putative transcription factor bzip protein [Botrytis fragariae]